VKNPDQVKEAVAEVNQLMPNYTIRDWKEVEELMTSSNIPGLSAFINAVVFIALCVGVLVIFLSMYTTITERTREIGILRSLGASKAYIVSLIFQESTFVCVLGVVFGIAASYLISSLLERVFPTLVVLITIGWIVRAAMFAIASGIIGAFYPSLK